MCIAHLIESHKNCPIMLVTYYARNFASIIGASLLHTSTLVVIGNIAALIVVVLVIIITINPQ